MHIYIVENTTHDIWLDKVSQLSIIIILYSHNKLYTGLVTKIYDCNLCQQKTIYFFRI